MPRPENAAIYARYKALAAATPGVHFVGRLATYKYYNMDQVVAQALKLYRTIAQRTGALNEDPSVLELPAAAPLQLAAPAKIKRSRAS